MPTGPAYEEQAYYNVTSSPSWTGMAFALFTAALTYGVVGMYGAAAAGSAGTAAAGNVAAAGDAAYTAAAAYAGGSLMVNGGLLTLETAVALPAAWGN